MEWLSAVKIYRK